MDKWIKHLFVQIFAGYNKNKTEQAEKSSF